MSDAAGTPVLSARGLRKEHGKGEGLVRAVDGVDLDVGAGETVAITGPSGSGKSTLLHLLGGLDRPSGGEVSLNGRRIDDIGEKALARMRRTEVSYVFQSFPDGGAHRRGERRAGRAARRTLTAVRAATRAGAAGPARARRPGQQLLPSVLSGGQRQRGAVARALSNEPLVVLADEPTGNLDSAATSDVLRLFEDLHESGQTLVIVTHDARIAATADRTFSMRDGALVDGTRLAVGTTGQLGALVGPED
ncbi:ABC transporter ATP-binding protein [Nonomuraea sp. SMC257]|uniref:ABC transporter ATP-binding protein n=1 Tax=Nonomuraea montanisoli TaxID=2741721 RepID=A0A7Y6ICP9_9ACTN|nr:ABC transporter ATP-binding protein [Nonomuraea montanisoli]NUW35726.1 ABC transporter ATP-binding protein [Nonomuraea montanisoli]